MTDPNPLQPTEIAQVREMLKGFKTHKESDRIKTSKLLNDAADAISMVMEFGGLDLARDWKVFIDQLVDRAAAFKAMEDVGPLDLKYTGGDTKWEPNQ